jgi:hypothetical protein
MRRTNRTLLAAAIAAAALILLAPAAGAGGVPEFAAEVTPTTVEPGGTLTIEGIGCDLPLAGAVLVREGTGLGVGDVVEPDVDTSFVIDLVVPAATTPGPLVVQVDCGFDGQTVMSLDLDVTVAGPPEPVDTSTTSVPEEEPEAAPSVAATPAFTG